MSHALESLEPVPTKRLRPTTVTPLEKLADAYLTSLVDRGRIPVTIARASVAVRGLTAFAREKGHTAWRNVGPATVLEFFKARELAGKPQHRSPVQTFFRWLGRNDQPVLAVLDLFSRTRWKRPRVDSYAAHPLNEQIERFLDWGLRVRRWSPNTLATYRIQTIKLRDFLIPRGHVEWGEVRREDLDDYLRRIHESGVAPATSRTVWVILRSLLDYLDAVDVRRNDSRLMARPPKIPKRIPDHLTVAETARLLDSIRGDRPLDLRDKAILEFAYSTACRVSEIAGLTLSTLDLEEGVARVVGKGSKERLVPINQAARGAIAAWLERGRPQIVVSRREEQVFLDSLGEPMSRMGFGKIIKRRAKACGLERRVYPHLLRHTACTHLLRAGADLLSISILAGHSSLETTRIYAHADPRQVLAVIRHHHPRA